MTWPAHIWAQLKNLTADELIAALEQDGWTYDAGHGSARIYFRPPGRRVSIHYHPHKTFGKKLLQALLSDIGWSADDLRRLKLIR